MSYACVCGVFVVNYENERMISAFRQKKNVSPSTTTIAHTHTHSTQHPQKKAQQGGGGGKLEK